MIDPLACCAPQATPLNWLELESLARSMAPGGWSNFDVYVVRSGGRFTLDDVMPGGYAGRTGQDILVVFDTDAVVTIGAGLGGPTLPASILAPFSRVIVEDNLGSIDGFVVAKVFVMSSGGSAIQLNANCYNGPLACSAFWASPADCTVLKMDSELCPETVGGTNSTATKNITAVCNAAGMDPDDAIAQCDEGLGDFLTEICAYDYCSSGGDNVTDMYKSIDNITRSEVKYLSSSWRS